MVDCENCKANPGLDPNDYTKLCTVCKGSGHTVRPVEDDRAKDTKK